jgi:hypothetical protein
MGECPKGLTIHRINNNGNYHPKNCVWGTDKEQSWTKSTSFVLTVRGVTACLAELVETFGGSYHTIKHRLYRGWAPEDAFFKPTRFKSTGH